MSITLVYLLEQVVFRLVDFLRHWYVSSFLWWSHWIINLLERLDRRFALKITLRYLFVPLYQDRSIFGYILGFIFRSFRIVLALVFYAVIVLLAIVVYVVWVFIPPFLIYRIIWPYE